MHDPYKLQLAINMVGAPRVVFASVVSAITKPFGVKGLFYKIVGKEELSVNSFHRRCATANEIYRTVGVSEDGVIEAMELPGAEFNFGVQWHPEIMYPYDEDSRKIINAFIEHCRTKMK